MSKHRLKRRYGRAKGGATFVALLEAADPNDIIQNSPDARVRATKERGGFVKLTSKNYAALMGVLTHFVGLSSAEADTMIEER